MKTFLQIFVLIIGISAFLISPASSNQLLDQHFNINSIPSTPFTITWNDGTAHSFTVTHYVLIDAPALGSGTCPNHWYQMYAFNGLTALTYGVTYPGYIDPYMTGETMILTTETNYVDCGAEFSSSGFYNLAPHWANGIYIPTDRNVLYSSIDILNTDSSVWFQNTANSSATPKLTINIDPIEGGNVTGSGISCNVDTSSVCQYPISQVNSATLQANANCGYAFGGWIGKENPHAITPSADTTITAKFYKTFRNAATEGFRKTVSSWGDQCIVYARYETDIPYAACHGDAMDCFGLAKAAGYSTGSVPKVGAIAVFNKDSYPTVGHDGIVIEVISDTSIKLRHSNWCPAPLDSNCEIVTEDIVNIATKPVMGYIYPTPPQ